ncbi:RelA/SpoT family protein [Bartonella ancashensis]|uniref:GTP pyrophosphokinase rsh n=1 Tax=Bartonella ancashensis TaxID=1318743 RepID=A0A0M4M6X1_9HYPH|nr:bifunctional (p)ppGpp synthetase/guanosine-3',5'-bis(diphosphate) 3'-pyrophosphohydrolase [Bartonella ancashensis]ALE04004.1 GTP pyrophosphokinase, (p)ppGpp synthetase II [Bartonella ancashensis]
MMHQYELVERIRHYKPNVNEALLKKAYVYAMQKHGRQKRASGDLYFSHPLEVAAILTDMRLDEATIVVALLHDTIEDTDATRAEIDHLFGSEIGKLVEGLTKLKKLDFVSKKAVQAENLRKLLIAISDDFRVLLVKLADRLHNMRTLGVMCDDKRRWIAEETMDIYAPLAGRMGMQDMREELEDLSFFYLNPEGYSAITDKLSDLLERNRDLLFTIENELMKLFSEHNIKADVKSRQKRPYSVFRKMESKALSFGQLSDIFGFRVIVETVCDCYRALGIIHTTWSMVPGRFKDYISTPKQNGYRSIHTTIVGPSRQRVELQIRTNIMDKIAEYGVAAHSIYRDYGANHSIPKFLNEMNAYAWLCQTIQALLDGDNPEEFLEHTKLELFQDQVFCFTPKGRLIALPKGAIPIDFAYAVHTDIGNSCVGVKTNGCVMPLMTKLKNGDEVDIIRAQVRVPPAAWEFLVVTGKARSAIRRATRAAVRKQYSELGYRVLERSFECAGKQFSKDVLQKFLHRLARKDVEDVLASVGCGELQASDVIKAIYPDYQDQRLIQRLSFKPEEDGWFNIENAQGMIFKVPENEKDKTLEGEHQRKELPIRGISGDIPVRFSPEGAVPGDRIVGIMQPGAGIIIYPIQSPSLMAYDDQPERWIDVRWDINAEMDERFPSRINVLAINNPGSLAEISQIIFANDANIQNLSLIRMAPDFTEIIIDLEVWDLKYLNRILSQLKESSSVSVARRVHG